MAAFGRSRCLLIRFHQDAVKNALRVRLPTTQVKFPSVCECRLSANLKTRLISAISLEVATRCLGLCAVVVGEPSKPGPYLNGILEEGGNQISVQLLCENQNPCYTLVHAPVPTRVPRERPGDGEKGDGFFIFFPP